MLNDRPIILTFAGHYIPGFKAGGILRVLVNTINHLCGEFEFKIVTRDRDLQDEKPYPDIKYDQWQQVGNALVYYLPPQSITLKNIRNLLEHTHHHVLFLNSFFEPLTIKTLAVKKIFKGLSQPAIVAPYGEFAPASLIQKYPRKFIFIHAARLTGLYNKVIWRASSEFEKSDIVKVMKIRSSAIHLTGDFPIKDVPNISAEKDIISLPDDDSLKIVFLSRISREKNLDYALRVLCKVKARVLFDIFGPSENMIYWEDARN
jgi:glycosyltransferase involved in cell wall biosynthesis